MQAKGKVKGLTEKLQRSELEPKPGMSMLDSFEQEVNQELRRRSLRRMCWGRWSRARRKTIFR